jgi:hypothetical protein
MDMDIRLVRSRYLLALRLMAVFAASYAIVLANLSLSVQTVLLLLICLQGLRWSSWQPWVCGFLCETDNDTDTEQRSGLPSLVIKISNGRWLKVELINFYCLSWIQILEFRTASSTHTVIILPDSCSDEERRKIRCFLLAGHYRRRAPAPLKAA